MYKHSDEVKLKMKESHLKFKETDEGKKMHELTSKNLKPTVWSDKGLITCPHCGLTASGPTMGRWHFNNCRMKGL